MFRALIAALVLGSATLAQNPPGSAPAQLPDAPSQIAKSAEEGRILKIFPSWGVVQDPGRPFQPLTEKEKFMIFVRQSTDPFTVLTAAFDAGISQATDGLSGYGQGAQGYGKRLGAMYANTATGEFFKSFAFPVLLHQDPRYFRQGGTEFKRRFKYAISRTFVARSDTGTWMFNYAEVLGTLASTSISNAYYPESDRGVGRTFARTGFSVGTDAAYNLLNEFGPDLKKKFLSKKHPAKRP
jgi:hypothetical protein